MTERDWLRCTKPREMLFPAGWVRSGRSEHEAGNEGCHPRLSSERKFRLYACACLRLAFPQLVYAADRAVLELAERYADDAAVEPEMDALTVRCGITAVSVTRRPAIRAARTAVGRKDVRPDHPAGREFPVTDAAKGRLLRDIFGNPFRPVVVDPSWRTSTAVAVAEGVYADRAFDRLPILADALQDAGCEDADILGHLRSEGPHVRGCWALDLVLGRE